MSSEIRRELYELLGDIPPAAADRLVDELEPYVVSKIVQHRAGIDVTTSNSGLIERVGRGILVTFSSGASIHFPDRSDAQLFGQNLMFTAALGGDVLDDVEKLED